MRTETTLDQDCGTESNCVRRVTVQRRVFVGDKCVFQQEATFGTKQQGITSMETLRIKNRDARRFTPPVARDNRNNNRPLYTSSSGMDEFWTCCERTKLIEVHIRTLICTEAAKLKTRQMATGGLKKKALLPRQVCFWLG